MSTSISANALKKVAGQLAATMPQSKLPIGSQLEAWALLSLGAELKRRGVGVLPMPAAKFYVRMNQHKGFKTQKSSWLQLKGPGGVYELHNALQVRGRSGAHHEVDVCLVAGAPKLAPVSCSRVIAGIECKQHAAALTENTVRALLGMALDCRNSPRRAGRKALAVVSTNPSLTSNLRALINYYGINFIGLKARSASLPHDGIKKLASRVRRLLS